jgi:hypothetical protein
VLLSSSSMANHELSKLGMLPCNLSPSVSQQLAQGRVWAILRKFHMSCKDSHWLVQSLPNRIVLYRGTGYCSVEWVPAQTGAWYALLTVLDSSVGNIILVMHALEQCCYCISTAPQALCTYIPPWLPTSYLPHLCQTWHLVVESKHWHEQGGLSNHNMNLIPLLEQNKRRP